MEFSNLSLGYIKDALACIIFIALFLLILYKNIHKNKTLLLSLLGLALAIDLTFTLIPELHNKTLAELL